jgi:DNA helicase HerA-like ATPase
MSRDLGKVMSEQSVAEMIPDAVLTQHIVALGKTRSGKSSTMRLLVERLLDADKPVCVIDPKGDWWGLKSSADGTRAGYPVMIFGGEHADWPLNEHAGAPVAELLATGNRPAIIDLGGWMVGERTRFFIRFASTFFQFTCGPHWLVIDEIHNFAPQGKVLDVDAGKMLHWARRPQH